MRLDSLDTLFSEYIRKRALQQTGGCERCGTPKYDIQRDDSILPAWMLLQCSHFIGRSKRATRWDEDNAAGLCPGCHMYFTSHPLEHVEFFKARLGDDFDLLQARARAIKPDKEAIRLYLEVKIKEMED